MLCFRPYEIDSKKRDKVLKRRFSPEKVPANLDALVIGSGISGLATAAVLAKSGKKVLVLEQHDRAGGCCHTFVEKGYEFDVGVHYVGNMVDGQVDKTLIDQVDSLSLPYFCLDVYWITFNLF